MNLFIFSDDLRTQDNKALYEASLDQDGLVALFIIDKYAGAKHLIDEMNVVYERHIEEKPADNQEQDMPEVVPSMK